HFAYRLAHADEHRPRDDRVADVQLANARKCGDRLHVEIVERMTGVEAHSQRAHRLAGLANRVELRDHRSTFRIASLGVKGMRVRTGVNFAYFGPDTRGRLDLAHIGVDENGGDDAGSRQLRDRRLDLVR